ncbi:MAG: translation initiation factor IF-2 [Eubacteriales bacterium]|nr:translation initiation factor IF-2 [Eubacteriales bacterium]MDD3882302.1 translation initiation factor IF-2 [Eubacteriales bacterium]MDD4512048.1 translation initiation factor IF-2 [Eubacteriales bacterium]
MTKVKLRDTTKELTQGAGELLEKLVAARKKLSGSIQQLQKTEAEFRRAADQAENQRKLEEAQRMQSMHQKAYTMPDDEIPETEAVSEDIKSAPVKTDDAKFKAPAAEEQKAPKAAESAEKKQEPETAKASAQARELKPEAKADAQPEAKAEAEKKPAPAVQAQKNAAQPAKAEGAEEAAKPADAAMAAKPAQRADAPRPAAVPVPPRPAQGPYGRPANPQAGQQQYGRPANPQGPYGRPANPQGPYGRPANPQAGQQQYGRPANPQGPYGRPANPQQGGFGRPAGAAMGAPRPGQGQFGRPAGQGGYGRPAGGAPGARPMGGAGRPPMGARPPKGPELTPTVEKERVSNYDPNKKQYIRQHDPERVAKNRKQLFKESFSGYDDDVVRGGRKSRLKKPSAQQLMEPIKIEKAFIASDTITVKDLTERIGKQSGEIIKKLFLLGIMANINSDLDFDTAQLVASEFGVELELKLDKTAEDSLMEEDFEDTEDMLVERPPVITIMGHVDHGKTSLLDYIRKSSVTSGEAGGITQHIGAYQVKANDRLITFLDTPGHEAFTAMRARGAQVTDIAVLVVAADDGVMPQTVEAIHHCQAAKVPIIVAVNKMDKEGADPDRIKQDLTAYNLVPEEWGGDTMMIPVSAKTGEGVSELLDMILLQADVMQLRANPDRMARGVVIEAKLDKARGPLATVLLRNGTLHVGDSVVAGTVSGRVRAMLGYHGERMTIAGPSTPVEIAGFSEVPEAGDEMMAVEADHLAEQVADERREKERSERMRASSKINMDNIFSSISEGKLENLNLIIKADVQGSAQAVKQAMEKLTNDEVRVRILHSAVGAINEGDVNLASAFNALIIGFNVEPAASARELADKSGVDVRLYSVIYAAIDDMQRAMKGLLAPVYNQVIVGHAEVRSVFKITGTGTVAGSYVLDGKLQRNAQVRVIRGEKTVYDGKLTGLKRFKDDAKEVGVGYECGVSMDGFSDVMEGDKLECYVNEEVER